MPQKHNNIKITDSEALEFHQLDGKPGKLEITPSKPMTTQRDLSLAYSPGVAVPVKAIADDPSLAYEYTNKGNLVAVISNGTAILGLGALGALASKPVMEGKAVLFKRFADVNAIDLEVETNDADEFINCVRYLGASFGGINLEDISAPDCFIIEQRLREIMDIPVFHDDQHGTAIIAAAGFINALDLTGRDIKDTTLVVNGAGSAGIACIELMKAMGLPHNNAILCDSRGVIGFHFKRFADVNAIDLEVETNDADEFINCVRYLGASFGGINLEDISAPDCFIIEQRLREIMDIPVFHDDQHGTAIIAAAGFINALDLTGRDIKDTTLVVNGAGSAGIACIELMKAMGLPHNNAILCDSRGVIYKGRKQGMNQWKSAHAIETGARTLADALEGADAIFGLSVQGAITPEMVANMADKPIIFAMANPDPEITPDEVAEVRDDAIMATGRSDFPNQVNNVLGFPYIFRGALDVRASTINDHMKIAAAQAIATLAREDVPDEVAAAYHGQRLRYGARYIIPAPFDPRLIAQIPAAVAKAAMDSGVANRPIIDMDAYRGELTARLSPIAATLQNVFANLRRNPRRVVFAEGEEEQVVRAANAFLNSGLGQPVLIGREAEILAAFKKAGIEYREDIEIQRVESGETNEEYVEFLYKRMQRRGFLHRDCHRLVRLDRNIYGACMVALGHAAAMVTGTTRNWAIAYNNIRRVLDEKQGHCAIGISLAVCQGRTILIADTSIHEHPASDELADIAEEAASVARRLGYEPRVALLAYSNFGFPRGPSSERIRKAIEVLDKRGVDFEYDGEMAADVALNADAMKLYPFCRLSDTANVLIMPGWNSASTSTKMLQTLGGSTVLGPLLVGLSKPVQIASLGATETDLVNLAALAAYDIGG